VTELISAGDRDEREECAVKLTEQDRYPSARADPHRLNPRDMG